MKTPLRMIAFGLVFGLIFVWGCAAKKPLGNYLPLSPGRVWTYTVNIRGAGSEMIVEAGEPQSVEGNSVIPLSYAYANTALPTQIEYYRIQEDAILLPRIDNVQGQYLKKPFQVFIKLPLKAGAKWEWNGRLVPIGAGLSSTREKVLTRVTGEEKVITPAGTYEKAMGITFRTVYETGETSFTLRDDRWYVRGVGMVKEVLYDEQDREVMTAVLKKIKK